MKKGQMVEGVVKKVKFPNKELWTFRERKKASLLKMSCRTENTGLYQ